MKKRIECIVTGKVQMVMYRDFARRNAKALGIVGYVKNKDDGSVLVVGEGEEEALNDFISRLHKGPFLARVKDVSVVWGDASDQFNDFKIIY